MIFYIKFNVSADYATISTLKDFYSCSFTFDYENISNNVAFLSIIGLVPKPQSKVAKAVISKAKTFTKKRSTFFGASPHKGVFASLKRGPSLITYKTLGRNKEIIITS